MPQMAPMSWITLFMMFSTMLIVTATLNYYIYNPQMKSKSVSQPKSLPLPWKW